MGFYSPATIVKDAQRHGLKMLPVDVTKSEWNCTLEAVPSSEFSVLSDTFSELETESRSGERMESTINWLRHPMGNRKTHRSPHGLALRATGLRGRRRANALLRERAMTPHSISIHDLTHRVPELRKDELTMLAAIGALNAVSSFGLQFSRKPWAPPRNPKLETRNSPSTAVTPSGKSNAPSAPPALYLNRMPNSMHLPPSLP